MANTAEDIIDAEIVEELIIDEPITPRQQHIKELRMLLDLLEKNPELPMPRDFGRSKYDGVTFWPKNAVEAAKLVQIINRSGLGGKPWSKNNPNDSEWDAGNLRMKKQAGDILHLELVVSREGVCEKKVVGTERKAVTKVVVPQVTQEVFEDVDVIEFECKSLMSLADQKVMAEIEAAAEQEVSPF